MVDALLRPPLEGSPHRLAVGLTAQVLVAAELLRYETGDYLVAALALLYRRCRQRVETVRQLLDCLVAVTATRSTPSCRGRRYLHRVQGSQRAQQ